MFGNIRAWLWDHAKILIGIFISTMAIKSGGLIGRIFGSLGLSYITYKYVMPEIKSYLQGYMSRLNPDAYNFILYVKADVAMVLILSACAVRFASNLFLGQKQSS